MGAWPLLSLAPEATSFPPPAGCAPVPSVTSNGNHSHPLLLFRTTFCNTFVIYSCK